MYFIRLDQHQDDRAAVSFKRVSVVLCLLLLPLDAHNHVDDYSGTFGGVRKVHISALVTSP